MRQQGLVARYSHTLLGKNELGLFKKKQEGKGG